jgi:hypothetical protein
VYLLAGEALAGEHLGEPAGVSGGLGYMGTAQQPDDVVVAKGGALT